MYRYLSIFLLIILFSVTCFAHPWKPEHYVVIDTDGGFDDMRAITLMLASPEIRVVAIIASPGVLPAEETYKQVKGLLETYNHQGILCGINNSFKSGTDCKPARNFRWGKDIQDIDPPKAATDIISYAVKYAEGPVELVCLGSLNTAAQFQESFPENNTQIKSIYWSTELNNIKQSFNYKIDTVSFGKVSKNKNNLILISCSNKDFSWESIQSSDGKAGKTAYENNFYRSTTSNESSFSKVCYDENLVLYLHNKNGFFRVDSTGNLKAYVLRDDLSADVIQRRFQQILRGETLIRNQVLKQIPTDTSLYLPDIQKYVAEIISRYGKEEWQAAVLANEMHRHLGVVATIGVKMGIRAREYFGAGLDELYVVSHAGLNPPVSCMNDGLQVSTGATLGHGLIEADSTGFPKPEAIFIYMGQKLKITLKEEYRRKMLSELREATLLYGLNSDTYWEYVRQLAIKYWLLWDRNEIFELVEI